MKSSTTYMRLVYTVESNFDNFILLMFIFIFTNVYLYFNNSLTKKEGQGSTVHCEYIYTFLH